MVFFAIRMLRSTLQRHREVVPVHAPLQPRNRQPDDAVAQRRHLLHLHFALGADEQQLHIVAEPPLERLGNRHGRIDMSARSAARKYDLLHIPLFSYFDGFSEEFRVFSRP